MAPKFQLRTTWVTLPGTIVSVPYVLKLNCWRCTIFCNASANLASINGVTLNVITGTSTPLPFVIGGAVVGGVPVLINDRITFRTNSTLDNRRFLIMLEHLDPC